MSLRIDVYDPPGIATYDKKIESVPYLSASGTVYRRQVGRGSVTLPADYSRLDEIINVDPSDHTNDVASTVSVYRYGQWIQDMLVKASPNLVAGEPATLSLDGIEAVMDWAAVEAWDWDGTADFVSEFPDWVYGGRNLLVDPTLSESVCEPRISEFWTDATSGQWRVNVDGQTVDIDFDATASEVTTAYESLSTVTDVRVEGNGSSDTPWRVTFVEPCFPATTYTVTTNTLNQPINAALIQLGSEQAPGWTEAQPLFGNSLYGVYDEFEVATLPSATPAGTTEGLKFDGQAPVGFSFPGAQSVPAVTPGALVQGGVWVYVDAAGSYPMRLVLRTPSEEPLIADSGWPSTSVTGQTWTLLSFADATIPDWIDRAIFRVSYVGTADPPDIYVADAYLREGMAEATVGFIMGELLDDAQTDHAASAFPRSTITFINKTFTDSLDSAGNAWDSDVFVSIPRGMTYRKVLERIFGQLGYEWSLTPTAGTPGEWDLNIWNPDGRGTDYSSADTPSILFGQGTESGSATRALPPGNIVISEGANRYTSRAASSDSYGTIGRREWWQTDISYEQTQVDDWTDRQLTRFLDESLSPRFEISDPPAGSSRPVPLVDFNVSDTMNVDLATGGGKVSRDVEAISWRTVEDGVMFGVQLGDTQFDPIGGVGAGSSGGNSGDLMARMGPVNEGVRRLIDQFRRPQFQPLASAFTPTGGGGDPSVFVAAVDATDYEKAIANFQCTGSDDHEMIMAAYRTRGAGAGGATNGLRISLSSGQFNCDLGQIVFDTTNLDVHLHGMGMLNTVLRSTGTSGALVEIAAQTEAVISDLTLDVDSAIGNSTQALYINQSGQVEARSVWFAGSRHSIRLRSNNVQIHDCVFQGNFYAIETDSEGYRQITINNNHFFSGYVLLGDAVEWIVSGNVMSGSLVAYDARGAAIVGNIWPIAQIFDEGVIELGAAGTGDTQIPGVVISGNYMHTSGFPGIYSDAVENLAIGPNVIIEASNAVYLLNSSNTVINGLQVPYTQEHGILLENSSYCAVLNSFLGSAAEAVGNTYDNVHITGASDRNRIQGNTLRPVGSSGASRYGVNVGGTGECNIVVGNDLGDPDDYGTDALDDTASNTQLFWPADATYGDNFTDCGSGS